jgi:hypothetical protein|nr:MAG TPA: NinB protein [Caudoviricetes sp.]
MRAEIHDLTFTMDGAQVISFRTKDDCRELYETLKGKDLDVTAKKHREPRSLNANAYAWKLIDEISLATRISPKTVYRRALEDVPTIRYTLLVADEDVENAIADFVRGHIGRRCDKQYAYTGYTNVTFHSGSSDFDTRQMSMLIDNLIQDCRALGIETRPVDEIEALLEAWDGKMG